MNLNVDHVIWRVRDLDAAANRLVNEFGLASVAGGRHPGHGTANRIVPLGDTYLEMVAVVDSEEAAGSDFGRWVGRGGGEPPVFDALCLRSDDLEILCQRLDLQPVTMGRRRPDGVELRWRLAGLQRAVDDKLPFFIEWDVPNDLLPGSSEVPQPCGSPRLAQVDVAGDLGLLQRWSGDAQRVAFHEGAPGIVGVTVHSEAGEFTLFGVGS
jgi:hypothetical protein